MIDNPLEQLPWFLDAGADLVTVHAEVLDADGLARAVASIHAAGAKAAVSLKPRTAPGVLAPVVSDVDMVLVKMCIRDRVPSASRRHLRGACGNRMRSLPRPHGGKFP